ncbi:hypothetical protein EAH89_15195 [Roseomonas nepalensis]|uniref:Uncharacterized protein n=1 Tax=Muricoccus nepalensis TaxID=1854500 RepID=A0A502FWA9_9PROT|nr:hypothetical protein EAH89_15195 [Roseomonas nepalensis]
MLRRPGTATSRRAEGIPSAVAKLRQVSMLIARGKPVLGAVRMIGVAAQTYDHWRSEYGSLKLARSSAWSVAGRAKA